MDYPIKTNLVLEWKHKSHEAGILKEKIIERINYVVRTIFSTFNIKIDTWYFYGAGEGEVGSLSRAIGSNSVSFIVEIARNSKGEYQSSPMVILLKDGSEWGLESEFPLHWLFENFEQELFEGKKKFEEKEVERKKNQKELSIQKKLEDKVLVETAKTKLSKKELAALRRSL